MSPSHGKPRPPEEEAGARLRVAAERRDGRARGETSPLARVVALMIGLTLASYPLGLLLGVRWLLPLLNAGPGYALLVSRLRRGDRRGAVIAVLAWAAALALGGTSTFALWPVDPGPSVLNGPAYRGEMFHWIRTGVGTEGSVRSFLPQHLIHLAVFVGLSLVTASALSILMGAVLMNYMSYYVASLARAGASPWAVALCGWQPWALCRVAAFCILGAVLAEPALGKVHGWKGGRLRDARPYLATAAGLILADWLLKWALAPTWGEVLRRALPS